MVFANGMPAGRNVGLPLFRNNIVAPVKKKKKRCFAGLDVRLAIEGWRQPCTYVDPDSLRSFQTLFRCQPPRPFFLRGIWRPQTSVLFSSIA